jgi:hypothetical protein
VSRSYHEALLECMSTETTIRMQLFCMSIYPSFSSCFLLLCTSLIRRTSRVFHGFGERWVWFFRAASRSASRLLVDCARCIAFIEEAVQYSQALFRTNQRAAVDTYCLAIPCVEASRASMAITRRHTVWQKGTAGKGQSICSLREAAADRLGDASRYAISPDEQQVRQYFVC